MKFGSEDQLHVSDFSLKQMHVFIKPNNYEDLIITPLPNMLLVARSQKYTGILGNLDN